MAKRGMGKEKEPEPRLVVFNVYVGSDLGCKLEKIRLNILRGIASRALLKASDEKEVPRWGGGGGGPPPPTRVILHSGGV
jgi:hypothetical protein